MTFQTSTSRRRSLLTLKHTAIGRKGLRLNQRQERAEKKKGDDARDKEDERAKEAARTAKEEEEHDLWVDKSEHEGDLLIDQGHTLTPFEIRMAFSTAQSETSMTTDDLSELTFPEFLVSIIRLAAMRYEAQTATPLSHKVRAVVDLICAIDPAKRADWKGDEGKEAGHTLVMTKSFKMKFAKLDQSVQQTAGGAHDAIGILSGPDDVRAAKQNAEIEDMAGDMATWCPVTTQQGQARRPSMSRRHRPGRSQSSRGRIIRQERDTVAARKAGIEKRIAKIHGLVTATALSPSSSFEKKHHLTPPTPLSLGLSPARPVARKATFSASVRGRAATVQ
jgi:hypothetical protein